MWRPSRGGLGRRRSGVELRNDEVWLEADSVHLPPDTLLLPLPWGGGHHGYLELWTLSGHYAERLERGEEFDVWVQGNRSGGRVGLTPGRRIR